MVKQLSSVFAWAATVMLVAGCQWLLPEEVACDAEHPDRCDVIPGYVCNVQEGSCVAQSCPDGGEPSEEICDGTDNDCDGILPENERDNDGDGQLVCAGDCDDANSASWSGAPEVCDQLDNDCNGVVDDVSRSAFPDNQWRRAELCDLPENLEGDGYAPGNILYNDWFIDQNGDPVELYQFYGLVVVVELISEWCSVCQAAAPHLQDLWVLGQGEVVVITAMIQDADGESPDADDLNRWVDSHALNHPVVRAESGDFQAYIDYLAAASTNGGMATPTSLFVDREMRVAAVRVGFSNSGAQAFSDEVLALLAQ